MVRVRIWVRVRVKVRIMVRVSVKVRVSFSVCKSTSGLHCAPAPARLPAGDVTRPQGLNGRTAAGLLLDTTIGSSVLKDRPLMPGFVNTDYSQIISYLVIRQRLPRIADCR